MKWLTLLIATLLFGMAGWAQGSKGIIVGNLIDASGGSVAGADVTATNTDTGAEAKTKTNMSGFYEFVELSPGMYSVTVEAPGFAKTTVAPQRLVVASNLRVDVTLQIGKVSESITVDETSPQVNTQDAQLGRSITDIASLPILSGNGGRNALSLIALQPGVTTTPSTGAQVPGTSVGDFEVNGQRSQANNFILDGSDANDLAINIPDAVNVISPNALGEFRVVTGAMKAEYGRNSGAVIESTIKSGGNSFHGGATEIFRNKVLNSNNFFLNAVGTPKPKYNLNDFDANLGGPVIKNRTFFFVSYLGFRRVYGVSNSGTVFSDAERAAILAGGTPAAKAIVNITPPASSGNTLFSAPVDSLNRDQGLFKIDHRFSNSNNFSVSYFTERSTDNAPFSFSGPTIPGFGELDLLTFHNVALRDTHSFSPNVVNEALASYHRRDQPGVVPANRTTPASLGFSGIVPDDPSAAGPPFILINSINIGNTYQGPQARRDNTWQYVDNFNWIKGRHSLKFGVDYRAYQENSLFDFINNGYLEFTGDATNLGLVSVIPGLENNAAVNDFAQGYVSGFYDQSNANHQGLRDKFFSAYAQDDFKISRNLTMNIGLRYDYGAPITELLNRVNTFRAGQQSTVFPTAPVGLVFPGDKGISRSTYSPDRNNFGPRIGFAWDPTGTGKLSIRSGFGMFYNVPETELSLQFLGAAPYGAQVVAIGSTDMTHPYQTSTTPLAQNPFPFHVAQPGQPFDFTTVAPVLLTFMDPKFATPYAFQYDFQVQYQLAKEWLADVAYVGSQGRKLENRRDINPAILTPDATTQNEPQRNLYNINNPQNDAYFGAVFGGITDQLSDATSSYNSLQLSLEKRFSHGLTLTNAYTWAHCIDTGSGLRVNSNPFNASYDRGNCDTDVRHRYVGTVIYALPFFRDQRGVIGHLLGGFNVATVVTLQTGLPFDIIDGGDRSLTGAGDDRPDYIGGNVQFVDPRSNQFGIQNAYFNGSGGGTPDGAPNPYFRRVGSGGSVAEGAGRYGNLGRNVFHGPGVLNSDVSVWKNIRFTERQLLVFRADAFNFFNHTQFYNPGDVTGANRIDSPSFGQVQLARDPRLIQLELQYRF
jgi:Carboxypeptidase regulatory-like domain/TonB-dependent Receptor Plug Domain